MILIYLNISINQPRSIHYVLMTTLLEGRASLLEWEAFHSREGGGGVCAMIGGWGAAGSLVGTVRRANRPVPPPVWGVYTESVRPHRGWAGPTPRKGGVYSSVCVRPHGEWRAGTRRRGGRPGTCKYMIQRSCNIQ